MPSIRTCAAAASATCMARATRVPVRDGVSAVRWYVLAAVVIVLDQISKQIVLANIAYGERSTSRPSGTGC